MANSLIGQIEECEAKADEVVKAAQREARDIVKAVGEAVAAEGRQAGAELHEEMLRRVEDAKTGIQDEIKSLEMRRAAEHEALRTMARVRVPLAGEAIFERIVSDGNR